MTLPMGTKSLRGLAFLCTVALLGASLGACGQGAEDHTHDDVAGTTWNVTAWGRLYEVFPDVDVLAVGEVAHAHTHVTVLEGFSPLAEGRVEVILRDRSDEQVFSATEATRPGIFTVELRPQTPGDYDLTFRVTSPHGTEELRGGRVRVGPAADPGAVVVAPAPKGATDGGEPLPFLKEEQWRSDFATTWVRRGLLARSVEALARVRPAAGGEVLLTAPVDAVLRPEPWPFAGQTVTRGETLLRLVPRVAVDTSLATLRADAAAVAAELASARARLERLEELLRLEAGSRRETEELRARVEILSAHSAAAKENLQAARAARQGGGSGAVALQAPFSGQVADVVVSPGAAVDAATPLARLVRTDPLWLEAALPPSEARRLQIGGLAGLVAILEDGSTLRPDPEGVRLVSLAPEIDRTTGRRTAILELPGHPEWVAGTMMEVRLLLGESVEGLVVPTTALVDDGGVTVVYLQLSGESFARQTVRVVAREGDRAMVEGLIPGQRLVTRGGEDIRRSSLLASGSGHGHVH